MLRKINPDRNAVRYASSAHSRVRERLAKDAVFGRRLSGSFLYGSYRRATAVGNIKDVDVVLLTDFNAAVDTPKKALNELEAALVRCGYKKSALAHQDKSIRVDDPLPDKPDATLTLDIIPAIQTGDSEAPLKVPSPKDKAWIRTHPKAHIRRTSLLNDEQHGDGMFVPLVKIMKWWWTYQCSVLQPKVERPRPKGFWIECLTAENFDQTQDTYAEHFIAVLQSIVLKFRHVSEVPQLLDPGLSGEIVRTKMTLPEFQRFMDAADASLELAKEALEETDKKRSAELWREVFGDIFPSPPVSHNLLEVKEIGLESYSHAQTTWWPPHPHSLPQIELRARLYDDGEPIGPYRSGEEILPANLQIRFTANIPCGTRFDRLLWQVVNTGDHARSEDGLRGKYLEARDRNNEASQNPRENWEHTAYTGRHWIQVFAISGNRCIAISPRFNVVIVNADA